ncbi:MAG: MarR family winged helix-turn-helix transcriptional regulator [Limisphaerales bacterium]
MRPKNMYRNKQFYYYEILLKLLRVADTLWERSRLFFSKFNLSPSQFNILNLLYENKNAMTQIELSRRLLTHRSNITGLLRRLETKKLIIRRGCRVDKRATLVKLTPRGRTLINKIQPEFRNIVYELFKDIEITDPSEFLQILENIESSAIDKSKSLKNLKNKS